MQSGQGQVKDLSSSEYQFISKNWNVLIRPKFLEADKATMSPSYCKFVVKPLERGYGVTIGNTLRRILLSSLQGAAAVAMKIDGTVHEFSAVPGLVEDVMDIILNVKALRFRVYDNKLKTVTVNKEGAGSVTGADLVCPEGVEVVNKDAHIATVDANGKFKMELIVNRGKGYVTADTVKKELELPIGTIALDAVYSPVRKVNYAVTHARVGQRTDFDRLALEVWTDGSVEPADAVAFASKILRDQLSLFLNFESREEETEVPEQEGGSREQDLYEKLDRSVDELELSVRSANCLQNAGIRYIGELVTRTEMDMLKTKNFGRKSLNEIKDILSTMDLHLGMKADDWVRPDQREGDVLKAAETSLETDIATEATLTSDAGMSIVSETDAELTEAEEPTTITTPDGDETPEDDNNSSTH
jgi:DNA-directed RNA polymerase subunit alpha